LANLWVFFPFISNKMHECSMVFSFVVWNWSLNMPGSHYNTCVSRKLLFHLFVVHSLPATPLLCTGKCLSE
jgi:hypothetical protein